MNWLVDDEETVSVVDKPLTPKAGNERHASRSAWGIKREGVAVDTIQS